ncbi:hypothetical protein GLW04_19355 [Halobacillus litoralis]|uniref:Uncharacterized protein n=1 Tax=Halobacillus litoralis TaxID=45668 RepID=A0A845E050_9BACI|nr:hypothetical protein [Halobacillus litoralis]MYL22035.1 hypothetical protein [Halobacillus litoralis]
MVNYWNSPYYHCPVCKATSYYDYNRNYYHNSFQGNSLYSNQIYPTYLNNSYNRQNYLYRESVISLQNTAETKWEGHYLDIDGNTGEVILWPRLASGGYWKLIDHGDNIVSLQNTAKTQWEGHYLDIDGNTGEVILWPHLASGGYWKLIDHGDNIVSLQNTAKTQWEGHYLDIDGNTGEVILWPRLGRGGYWKIDDDITNNGNGPPKKTGVHRNLIKRVSYDEPYSKTCYKKVGGVSIPYPCPGMKTKVIEVYLETRYPPEATAAQKAAIVSCAAVAVQVAIIAFGTAYGGTGGTIASLAPAIAAAEIAGRNSFDECKEKSLPRDIARRTGISIVQEKYDR